MILLFKVNLSLNKSVLCYNRGIITLIPKQGKDPLLPITYRPIPLLNSDYSLVSKLVNNKMKRFLQTLTRSDRSDFVRRHYIDDKIRMLFDIVSFSKFKQHFGVVLFADFFKTFDSIKWDFF